MELEGLQGVGATDADVKSRDSDDGSCDVDESGNSSAGRLDLAGDERYAYIQRGYTTEIHKIELINLPPFVGYKVQLQTLQCHGHEILALQISASPSLNV